MLVAKDLEDVAKAMEITSRRLRHEAQADKAHGRLRKQGEAYGWEQAARMLRDLVWAADLTNKGFDADYAIPRRQKSDESAAKDGPAPPLADPPRE